MHLSEDLVQAHLDGELSEGQEKVCVQHLQHCASCHEKFEALQNRGNANRSRLDALLPAEKAPHPDVLLKRIQTERETEGSRVFQWKPAWAAAVGFAALIAAFAFEPVRLIGAEFLSLFRVQQIAVIRVDPANLQQLERDLFGSQTEQSIQQMLSADAQVVKRGESRRVASPNEAARVAGFGVRFPPLPDQPQIHVHPAVDVSFSIDVERLQGILDEAGRPDVRIPQELDGEMIRIGIPASVTALFGQCPDNQDRRSDSSERPHREAYPECKVVVQMPSPTLVAPPALDVRQIGAEMLKLFGLNEEQAEKFSRSIDWTTTLVLPLPVDPRMKFSEVEVDSVQGHLFATDRHGIEAYNLVWIRDGIVYSVMGQGNPDEALAIANSM